MEPTTQSSRTHLTLSLSLSLWIGSLAVRRVQVHLEGGECVLPLKDTFRSPQSEPCCLRRVVKPLLGALWKSELRPHHALDVTGVDGWRRSATAAARVQAQLALWRVDASDGGAHVVRVKLALTPIRGPSRARRLRPEYRAGPVPSLGSHAARTMQSLEAACHQASTELLDLLGEVRHADLKLEEVVLTQQARSAGGERRTAQQLQVYLRALAATTELAVIGLRRFGEAEEDGRGSTDGGDGMGRSGGGPTGGGAGDALVSEGAFGRRIARFDRFITRRDRKRVARLSRGGMLLLTFVNLLVLVRAAIQQGDANDVHRHCERVKLACDALRSLWLRSGTDAAAVAAEDDGNGGSDGVFGNLTMWRGACKFNGSSAPLIVRAVDVQVFSHEHLELTYVPSGRLIPDAYLTLPPCNIDALRGHTLVSLLPLPPLLLLSVALPFGLFHRNTDLIVIRKLLLWCPTVSLVLLQVTTRAAVITSTLANAVDRATARIRAIEAWGLCVQVV